MSLKIKSEHYNKMSDAIKAYLQQHPTLIEEYGKAGHSSMRLNWDVLRNAKIDGDSTRWICDVLYPYLDDDHINNALKVIMGNDGKSILG